MCHDFRSSASEKVGLTTCTNLDGNNPCREVELIMNFSYIRYSVLSLRAQLMANVVNILTNPLKWREPN